MRKIATLEDVVRVLNQAISADAAAVTRMFTARFPCNRALSEHPTIQCGNDEVGPLGIINGLFGVDADEYGPIAMVIGGDGLVERFDIREGWA